MRITLYLSLVLTGILAITSCTEDPDDQNDNSEIVKKAKIEVDTSDVYASEEFEFMLPQPFALVSSFENVDLVYDATHMNDPENVDQYNSEGKKLLNFGVYSTDLVYSIIHDQPQASMNYFNAVKRMADKIGMGSIFAEESLADSIEKHIADRNVMQDLLIDVHERSQDYLVSNDMRMLAAIQFAGAWTEGMYLATRDITPAKLNVLGVSVADHMTLAENAIQGIEAYKKRGKDLEETLKKIKSIKSLYESFDSVKNAKGHPKLTMEQLNTLQKEFGELRNLITQ